MLMNVSLWCPAQVLCPFGIEFHLGRRLENDILVSTSISLDVDSIESRLSFCDLVLIQSILYQRTLIREKNARRFSKLQKHRRVEQGGESLVEEVAANQSPSEYSSSIQVTTYSVSLNLGLIRCIIINDFNRQNLPVFQITVDGILVNADGVPQNMEGFGKVAVAIDFYNPRVCHWEPFLETWSPELSLLTDPEGFTIKIVSSQTLQFSVTGMMLDRLLQTYSVFLYAQEDPGNDRRTEVHGYSVKNMLGAAVEIRDGRTNKLLFLLDADETLPISDPELEQRNRSLDRDLNRDLRSEASLSVNVHFLGVLGEQREPVSHLSFNTNHPRMCAVLPVGGNHVSRAEDPVPEVVYENERYDALRGRWTVPFMLGDYCNQSDENGRERLKNSVKLLENWEWQSDWKVDLQGNGSIVLDAEGWAYQAIFQAFTTAALNTRRPRLHGDCVRRRKWVRVRQPYPQQLGDPCRALMLYWDVKTMQNGSRLAFIRSHFQVINNMPFPLMISLRNSAWAEEKEFGPIPEGQGFGGAYDYL